MKVQHNKDNKGSRRKQGEWGEEGAADSKPSVLVCLYQTKTKTINQKETIEENAAGT